MSSDTVDGGNKTGKVEIDPGGLYGCLEGADLCLCRLDVGLGGQIVLHRIVEILLTRCLLLGQGRIPIHVQLGPNLHGLCIGQVGLGLRELP